MGFETKLKDLLKSHLSVRYKSFNIYRHKWVRLFCKIFKNYEKSSIMGRIFSKGGIISIALWHQSWPKFFSTWTPGINKLGLIVYIYIYMCVCVCMYVCIYIYIHIYISIIGWCLSHTPESDFDFSNRLQNCILEIHVIWWVLHLNMAQRCIMEVVGPKSKMFLWYKYFLEDCSIDTVNRMITRMPVKQAWRIQIKLNSTKPQKKHKVQSSLDVLCIELWHRQLNDGFVLSRKPVPLIHDDVIKWKHYPFFGPFVRGIHLLPVNSLHKDQWREALTFSLICAWTNGWVNYRDAGDLAHHRAHYDVTEMVY